MVDFRMPSLGADMEAGTLVEWMVKPGDRVKRGDVVAVVETQKGAIEIEIFETGQVDQILVEVGSKVPVGTPLARVRTDGEAKAGIAVPPSPPPTVPSPAAAPKPPTPPVAAPPPVTAPTRAIAPPPPVTRISPAARRLAQERGLDLATIAGSGPDGAIVLADIERLPSARPGEIVEPAKKPKAVGLDLDAMRAAIAAAMARSKREIPHYYLRHDCLMAAAETGLQPPTQLAPPSDDC